MIFIGVVGGSVRLRHLHDGDRVPPRPDARETSQGIRVVSETGARISLGQAIVRQLPMFLQVYWIDAMFALFTDKSQRAFEMLSKTRVVRAA